MVGLPIATTSLILILVDAKEGAATVPGGVVPLVFTGALYDALDAEVRSVFGEDRLITPDQVQGQAKTLREGRPDHRLAPSWARRAARCSSPWTKAPRRSPSIAASAPRWRAGRCSSTSTPTRPHRPPPI
ncbi:Ca2+-dependent phosphoinositide-specific phospholipase C [Caulobacter segnis]